MDLVRLVFVCGIVVGVCEGFFDIIQEYAPRIKPKRRNFEVAKRIYLDKPPAEKLLEQHGYPFEEHTVLTEDGYLLSVHRIPHGKKSPKTARDQKPVVLIHHGILASSDSWLLQGPDKDLAYILADSGYDVWLSNCRGNVYSRRHISMDPDTDTAFWLFSFHEIGYYDLPATIDYILEKTNQKNLFYVGHSMGCTVFFVLCSTRPEYNAKIKMMTAMAPAVLKAGHLAPFLKLTLNFAPTLDRILWQENIFELFPLRKFNARLGRALCQDASPTQPLCLAMTFVVVGVDYAKFNKSLLPEIFAHFPSGVSVNTFRHFSQVFSSGLFRFADYGPNGNFKRYGLKQAPEYDLSKVVAPVTLHYSDGDLLVNRKDTEALAAKLPNVQGIHTVPYPYFNHLDFLWSSDLKTLLNDLVVSLIGKFNCESRT